MERSVDTQKERRRFAYGPGYWAIHCAVLAGGVWAIHALHRQEGWNALVVMCALLLPGAVFEWSLRPICFLIEGERLTAVWCWGRRRSWPIRELTVPGASGRWAFFAPGGGASIHHRTAGYLFAFSAYLEDVDQFVELIEPGSSERRKPKHNPNSWWNRELFK